VGVQQRQNDLGSVLQLGQVQDVIALEIILKLFQEILDLLAVDILQGLKDIGVEVILGELLGGIEQAVDIEIIGLGRGGGAGEDERDEKNQRFHTA
jgi:hypothetical protein